MSSVAHAFNRFICSRRDLWLALADTETRMLRKKLDTMPQPSPIYITGLARGGTTIMLELMAQSSQTVTHTYRDFPLLLTPFALRKFYHFFDRFDFGETRKVERPHKDRIMVTPASPESMEEVLWISFFKKLHEETQDNSLSQKTSLPAFERFYTAHIKKLMLAEQAQHYISKANYNITRIRYLRKLFPTARFVLVIREPAQHIASLIKQHRLFCEEHAKKPYTLEHMNLSGHFEFGLGRKLIHTGDDAAMQAIQAAFAAGQDIEGWARYWNSLYGYALGLLQEAAVRHAVQVVHYDELCANPLAVLTQVYEFCGLPHTTQWLNALSADISEPTYYKHGFDEQALATIRTHTAETYTAYNAMRILRPS